MVVSSKMTPNYVVFTKATTALWTAMPDSQKNSNTLYFVVDGANDDIGQLYLGKTLIATGSGVTASGLQNLADVNIDVNNLDADSILVYNPTTEKWEADSLANQIGNLIDVFNGHNKGLVPQPANSEAFAFLKADGSWEDPTTELKATIATLLGDDELQSIRDIAKEEVLGLVANAPEEFDTLKEIADWIQSQPELVDIADLESRLQELEKTIDGYTDEDEVEHLGLSAVVSGLQVVIAAHEEAIDEHADKILAIEERLRWQELYDSSEEN